MTQAVIARAIAAAGCKLPAHHGADALGHRPNSAVRNAEAARVAGIDVDLDAHPGAQRRQILVAGIEAHAHRHALHDLDPIAAGVLRRQQRELLRRGRADAFDTPCHSRSG
jgi:hypothetical protein